MALPLPEVAVDPNPKTSKTMFDLVLPSVALHWIRAGGLTVTAKEDKIVVEISHPKHPEDTLWRAFSGSEVPFWMQPGGCYTGKFEVIAVDKEDDSGYQTLRLTPSIDVWDLIQQDRDRKAVARAILRLFWPKRGSCCDRMFMSFSEDDQLRHIVQHLGTHILATFRYPHKHTSTTRAALALGIARYGFDKIAEFSSLVDQWGPAVNGACWPNTGVLRTRLTMEAIECFVAGQGFRDLGGLTLTTIPRHFLPEELRATLFGTAQQEFEL